MLEAALGMVAALIGWWARRRIKKLEDDNNEYKELAWDIDAAISEGDKEMLNSALDGVLDKLRVESSRHSSQQDSRKNTRW
jgi:alpha-D-ribose 1-methylphosphonate 5-triphosphate diphosphatase PhnM